MVRIYIINNKVGDKPYYTNPASSVSDPYSSNPDRDLAKNLNPDPDPGYFFALSEKKLKLCYYYRFLSSKEVN